MISFSKVEPHEGTGPFISAYSICLATLHTPSFAGAWSQQTGHYYAKVSGIYYTSDERYNDMGKRDELGQDGDEFRSTQGFLYVEYGLADRLTTVAQFQGSRLVNENALIRQTTVGAGDVDLGLKYQWIDAPLVLAPFVTAKIPGGYDKKYEPPLGTGDIDLEFRLLMARSSIRGRFMWGLRPATGCAAARVFEPGSLSGGAWLIVP